MDLRRKRNGSFTGYPFTGVEFKGYPFAGYKFGEDVTGAQLAFIWHGEPTVYSYFTRDGDAYSEEPDGSITTVGTDVPAYEYDGGDKLFRQYSGTGTLPFPPATYVTVNPSTLSLLSEDVDLTARTPWISGTTPYGLTGLFEGVGAAGAIGTAIFEKFTLKG